MRAILALALVAAACAAVEPLPPEAGQAKPPILGWVTRAQIEAEHPEFRTAGPGAASDRSVSSALAGVSPGARVEVFFGSWCSDSRRELSRFWSALDLLSDKPPFEVHYLGVDRSKREPSEALAGREILFVPTFVVSRGGHEVGRVVESAPKGIEYDLLDLLSGAAIGVRTLRGDLARPATLGNQGRR